MATTFYEGHCHYNDSQGDGDDSYHHQRGSEEVHIPSVECHTYSEDMQDVEDCHVATTSATTTTALTNSRQQQQQQQQEGAVNVPKEGNETLLWESQSHRSFENIASQLGQDLQHELSHCESMHGTNGMAATAAAPPHHNRHTQPQAKRHRQPDPPQETTTPTPTMTTPIQTTVVGNNDNAKHNETTPHGKSGNVANLISKFN